MDFIMLAIPFFLLLIVIEIAVDRYRNTEYYRFNDMINSLGIGILSRVIGIVSAIIPFSLYVYLHQNFSTIQWPNNIWGYIAAFIIYDAVYYWSHRINHRVAWMWGSHVVHHSSEEYNLTTALRQTSTPSLFGWAVFLPLALLGIPPLLLIACGSLNLIYQFWVHTRHIDKMPAWYEAIFVTPSHHRVHHALNRAYIDKNFAGVFIVWDKIFGSFQAEDNNIELVYGVSHQLKSWNPIWANIQVYLQLLTDAFHANSWRDKFNILFKPPGWRPDDVAKKYPLSYATTKNIKKYDVSLPLNIKVYLSVQFVIYIALVITLLVAAPALTGYMKVFLCIIATLNLLLISRLQENKAMGIIGESARIIITLLAIIIAVPMNNLLWFSPALIAWAVLSLVTFWRISKENGSHIREENCYE